MKDKFRSYIPINILFFLYSLAILLVINFMFRLSLWITHFGMARSADLSDILFTLLVIGFRFDLYISLILLLLPFIIVSIPFLKNKSERVYLVISSWLVTILGTINIAVASSDQGFFQFYNARITKSIFSWTNEPDIMFKIMANDINYLGYFLIFLCVVIVFVFFQFRILKSVGSGVSRTLPVRYRIAIFFAVLILILFGIRGSFNFNASPLKIDHAYHSENLFLNQLSLNPVYTLAHSYTKIDIEYFDSPKQHVTAALGYLERAYNPSPNPFEQSIEGADSLRPNIMLIFLESMSNAMVSRYQQELKTTPFLDSLAQNGIVFDHFYSAGVHTHNAITATFYALPAVMDKKLMGELATAHDLFYGMPWILKERGYANTFYVTGSKKFDNMGKFLTLNGFDRVIGERDYPGDSIYNSWGVTDKTMFNRVMNDCDAMHRSGQKFFTAVLTISAHEGYLVPKRYRSQLVNKKHPFNLYEFSDRMLAEFFHAAETKDWYDETVFVLVGDHGQNFSTVYDVNLNYHRVPMIIYAPKRFKHRVYDSPGLQMDIYPTLFGLLDFSYTNNGFGVDLFKHERPFAYFSADTKLGIIDDNYFLIYRNPDNISLYEYTRTGPLRDIYTDDDAHATKMMNYGFSMIQSAKFLIDNELMGNGLVKQQKKEYAIE